MLLEKNRLKLKSGWDNKYNLHRCVKNKILYNASFNLYNVNISLKRYSQFLKIVLCLPSIKNIL